MLSGLQLCAPVPDWLAAAHGPVQPGLAVLGRGLASMPAEAAHQMGAAQVGGICLADNLTPWWAMVAWLGCGLPSAHAPWSAKLSA